MSLEYSEEQKLVNLRDNYGRVAFLPSAHESPMLTLSTERIIRDLYFLTPYIVCPSSERVRLNALRPYCRERIEQRVRDVFTLSHNTAEVFTKHFSDWFEDVYNISGSDDQRTSETAMIGMGFILDAQILKKGNDYLKRINAGITEERFGEVWKRVTVPEVSKKPFATAKMSTSPLVLNPFPDEQQVLNRLLPPLSWVVSNTLRQQEALIDGATSMYYVLMDIEDELNG